MDSQNRQRYLKITESQSNNYIRTIERLREENARLRNKLTKYIEFESMASGTNIQKVVHVINKKLCVDINCHTRKMEYVRGRMYFYVWCRKNTILSLDSIANLLDTKHDHSTLCHFLEKHADFIRYNKQYRDEFNEIMSLIDSVLSTFTENS